MPFQQCPPHFIKYYYEAYDVALHNAQKRLVMNS